MALSNICLGNKPSLIQSYRRVLGSMVGKLLLTNILQVLIIAIGLVLLIVPGIIFTLWLIFVPAVVVLEGTWGFNALKRSKALSKGYCLRIFGIGVVLFIFFFVIGGVIGAVFGLVFPHLVEEWQFRLLLTVIQTLVQPTGIIAVIILYYDLRARKEAYDNTALAEDLKR